MKKILLSSIALAFFAGQDLNAGGEAMQDSEVVFVLSRDDSMEAKGYTVKACEDGYAKNCNSEEAIIPHEELRLYVPGRKSKGEFKMPKAYTVTISKAGLEVARLKGVKIGTRIWVADGWAKFVNKKDEDIKLEWENEGGSSMTQPTPMPEAPRPTYTPVKKAQPVMPSSSSSTYFE